MQSFGHKALIFPVKQLIAFRKVLLLKPLNKQRHHQKLCVCLLFMLKFKVTTMGLALFVGRHCLYAHFGTFLVFVIRFIIQNLTKPL